MRIVLQRVLEAQVKVDKAICGEIGPGLLILLGIESEDDNSDMDWIIQKLINMRIFNDVHHKMNRSIQDIKGSFLVVSQFTLHASTKKGNRPSFIKAARPEKAEPMYNEFCKRLREQSSLVVESGIFGADMKVGLINDGPVTIIIDSKNRN